MRYPFAILLVVLLTLASKITKQIIVGLDHLVAEALNGCAGLPLHLAVLDQQHGCPRQGAVPVIDYLFALRMLAAHVYPQRALVADLLSSASLCSGQTRSAGPRGFCVCCGISS